MRSVQAKEKGILSTLWLGMARVKLENFPPSCSPPVRFSPLGRSILLSLEIHKLFFPVPFLRNFNGVVSRGLETRAQEFTCIRGPRNQFCVCSWIQGERFAKLNKRERERENLVASQIKRTHLTGVRVIEAIVASVDPFSLQHRIYIVQFDLVVGCTSRFQTRRVLFKRDAII